MTLRELWQLAIRYWMIVLALVVVGMLLGFGYSSLKASDEEYQAEAKVVAGSNLSSVAGLAENAKRSMQFDLASKGVSVSVATQATVMTVTITAEGPNSQACIEAANSVADTANETAIELYSQAESPYNGQVSHAEQAIKKSSTSFLKFVLFGFIGGLVLAVIVLILLDLKNRYVKSAEYIQSRTDLPMLESLPASNGDRLLANVRFVASQSDHPEGALSVLVIPVGQGADTAEVVSLLAKAAEHDTSDAVQVEQVQPLSDNISGAYSAKKADVVVVVIEQWRDSVPAVISCFEELQLADANVAGFVFCKNRKHRAA